ncbi:MAG: hypothetical protein JXK95_12970 [Bacteroidales bacterium]|nr:hypothetical protein [Bacteroidales bacterium]
MPYRRLPNTDVARLRALRIAFEKGKELPPFDLAYTQSTLQRIQSFLPTFEKILMETRQAYNLQVEKSKDFGKVLRKARLYISHFIQVVNMAIARGDLPAAERNFFSLSSDQKNVPLFNTEAELINWGEKLISGENMRISKGRTPITNPTIAVVKVWYEKFMDTYKYQKILQKNHARAQEKLNVLKKEADEIILAIWNEVEHYYSSLSEDKKRENAKLYGLVYVLRKAEKKKLEMLVQSANGETA